MLVTAYLWKGDSLERAATEGTLADGNLLKLELGELAVCAYWRPGGKNMKERYFYNAVVASIHTVKHPGAGSSGAPRSVQVFGVN